MGCIELETPQTIKDSTQVDVFDVMAGTSIYKAAIKNAMWSRFRYRAIGHTNVDYWKQCLQDRFNGLELKYNEMFAVYTQYKSGEYAKLSDGDSTIVYEHEDTPDTDITGKKYLSSRDTQNVTTYSGLPAVTLKDDLDAVTDPYALFAKEFDNLFYNGLELCV